MSLLNILITFLFATGLAVWSYVFIVFIIWVLRGITITIRPYYHNIRIAILWCLFTSPKELNTLWEKYGYYGYARIRSDKYLGKFGRLILVTKVRKYRKTLNK